MITELITFPPNPSSEPSDPNSPPGAIIREELGPSFRVGGARWVYYGLLVEKPDTAVMFVGWDSVEDYERFREAPIYQSHHKLLKRTTNESHPTTHLHIPFNPHSSASDSDPSPALGANPSVGVTELVFFYFPSTLHPTARETIMTSVDKMRPVVERSESLAVFDGWALEEDVGNPAAKEGEEAESQVYVNVVGWVDVDAHMRFQGSEEFGANIHYLLGIGEIRYTEVFHAKMFVV